MDSLPKKIEIPADELERCLDLLKLFKIGGVTVDTLATEGQIQIFHALIFKPNNRVNILVSTQYGKLVSDDTPVWTTKGWKTHGELGVGDFVFNHNGKKVKITFVHPKGFANREVEFSNGEKIKVHENHEWLLSHPGWRAKYKNKTKVQPFRKVETKKLESYKTLRSFSLPKVVPLEGKGKLLLDPYFLGVWLGDGISTKPAFVGHPKDEAILAGIPYRVSATHTHKTTGVRLYNFYRSNVFGNLRKLNLIKNKHIPDVYKLASVEDRLKLLAGLIDTDGHVNKPFREKGWRNGRVYISNANKTLIDDIADVVHGLGMRTSITKVKACLSSSGVQGKQDVYYLGFRPELSIPTLLPRKKIEATVSSRSVRIKSIKKIKETPGNCITVEGGVYLLGKKMIPTHNSLFVALACLIITCIKNEMVAVVAPTGEKSKIIMRYYIDHIGDSPLFYELLDANTKLERLKQEENKERIILRNGGGIFTISANVSNSLKSAESAMGLGCMNVIQDESGLIPDDVEATIYRMIAGQGPDAFYGKLGNPFYRNPPYTHFYKSTLDPRYYNIFIDYKRGLKEGRYTESFIEEARLKPQFEVLFECIFPPEDAMDKKGWIPLLSESEIQAAMNNTEGIKMFGEKVFGGDCAAGGGDRSTAIVRGANIAEIRYCSNALDLMEFTGVCLHIIRDENINGTNAFYDSIGVGVGLGQRLREQGQTCTGVNVAEKATDEKTFLNKKAEAYWRLRQWIKSGGKLKADERWLELAQVKYKTNESTGRLQIIPKEQLRNYGVPSTDIAEALMLTFVEPVKIFAPSMEDTFFMKKMAENKRKEKLSDKLMRKLVFHK